MCLIIACPPNVRPSLQTLEASRKPNDDGSGIAWIENERVHWIKGLHGAEVDRAIARVPMASPLVIHDRLSTVGGECAALTHPFLIGPASPTAIAGSTKGSVLFHNGHWHDWKTPLLHAIATRRAKLPRGEWSDSRAIAFLIGTFGLGYLDLEIITGQRLCIVSPEGWTLHGYGWSEYEGCQVSNLSWKPVTIAPSSTAVQTFGFGARDSRNERLENYREKRRKGKAMRQEKNDYQRYVDWLAERESQNERIRAELDAKTEAEAREYSAFEERKAIEASEKGTHPLDDTNFDPRGPWGEWLDLGSV